MQANDMNVMIFWVCVAIAAVVYAVIIWSLVAYRKTKKQEASFHKSTATEIAWTVIPLLIFIAMTIPAAKVLTRLYEGESGESHGLHIDLLGEQKQEIALEQGEELNPLLSTAKADTDIKVL